MIRLREPTSISTECRSIPPLVVIDGVVQPEDFPISDVKAMDIAHVEIVRGVAATILYGPRGENGVIEIQTKRGKKATLCETEVTTREAGRLPASRVDLAPPSVADSVSGGLRCLPPPPPRSGR